jgi:hypothetical protein
VRTAQKDRRRWKAGSLGQRGTERFQGWLSCLTWTDSVVGVCTIYMLGITSGVEGCRSVSHNGAAVSLRSTCRMHCPIAKIRSVAWWAHRRKRSLCVTNEAVMWKLGAFRFSAMI